MEVGADGVAVITLENGKVNALHPTGVIISASKYKNVQLFFCGGVLKLCLSAQ